MRATIFVLALATATASFAIAGPFTQVCDTGVSNCTLESPITTQGVADSNFAVTSVPSGVTSPTAVTFFTSGYFQSGTNLIGTNAASWITTKGVAGVSEAIGTFNYQEAITADVTGSVTITGNWATDNCGTLAWGGTSSSGLGTAVTGTGATIGGGANSSCSTTNTAPFNALTAFSFNETVNAGTTYYLDFNVYNSGLVTALLVDTLAGTCTVGTSCVGASTPEPSSVLLTLTGMGMLSLGLWRRRAANRTHP
jgi:hypothetical protein